MPGDLRTMSRGKYIDVSIKARIYKDINTSIKAGILCDADIDGKIDVHEERSLVIVMGMIKYGICMQLDKELERLWKNM